MYCSVFTLVFWHLELMEAHLIEDVMIRRFAQKPSFPQMHRTLVLNVLPSNTVHRGGHEHGSSLNRQRKMAFSLSIVLHTEGYPFKNTPLIGILNVF